MKQIFADTSYWIALELTTDSNHLVALRQRPRGRPAPRSIVTTSYVLDEITAYFNSRNHHTKAVRVGESMMNSDIVYFVHVDEPLFQAGWAYFKQHTDKEYSLTDCISFVVMQQLGITTALTFDRHFAQAGFTMVP